MWNCKHSHSLICRLWSCHWWDSRLSWFGLKRKINYRAELPALGTPEDESIWRQVQSCLHQMSILLWIDSFPYLFIFNNVKLHSSYLMEKEKEIPCLKHRGSAHIFMQSQDYFPSLLTSVYKRWRVIFVILMCIHTHLSLNMNATLLLNGHCQVLNYSDSKFTKNLQKRLLNLWISFLFLSIYRFLLGVCIYMCIHAYKWMIVIFFIYFYF